MFKKRDVWIVFALVLISGTAVYFSNTYSNEISLQPASNCTTPPRYPTLIRQSSTLCPGNYSYGIGIGADNVTVSCRGNVNFIGVSSNIRNGLTIQGVKNVTVIGCNFERFRENGIFIGNVSNHTSKVTLINVKSNKNANNGIYVGHSVVNFYLNKSEITLNKLDGILLQASYLGFYNQSSAKLFPMGIYISENNILSNRQNGINFDAYDYMALIYSPLFGGNVNLFSNNSILVFGNNIEGNYNNGIQNLGLYAQSNFQIVKNIIKSNGLIKGSGILVISNKSNRVLNYSDNTFFNLHGIAEIGYIYSNDITSNKLDGISMYLAQNNPSYLFYQRQWSLILGNVDYNYIINNSRHGISFEGQNTQDYLLVFSSIKQNDISFNFNDSLYFKWHNYSTNENSIGANIFCNDIRFSGMGNENGIDIGGFKSSAIEIGNQNIIENNLLGIIIEQVLYGGFNIGWNHIGANSGGVRLIGNPHPLYNSRVLYNDFDSNVLQAYDLLNSNFTANWWSDYSPTCVDGQPDGWCDIPRPVPVANQDNPTKAGPPWSWKNRGYFARANPGVIPIPSCPISVGLPPLPIITVPQPPSSGGPIIVGVTTGHGTGGTPGTGTGTGTDGAEGGGEDFGDGK